MSFTQVGREERVEADWDWRWLLRVYRLSYGGRTRWCQRGRGR